MSKTSNSKVHSKRKTNLQEVHYNFLHDFLVPPKIPDDSTPNSAQRYPRAPTRKTLNNYVNHIEMIARVANGATLVNGLVSGTISGNDVIAELLHMGSLTPEELIAMNEKKIMKLLESFSGMSTELVENPTVVELEDNYVALNAAINGNFDYEEVIKLEKKTEYESVLAELAQTTIDATAVKVPYDDASSLLADLKKVPKLPETLKNNPDEAVRNIDSIDRYSVNLGKSLEKYEPVLDLVRYLKSLEELSLFLEVLADENNARKDLIIKTSQNGEMDANFKLFGDKSVDLGAHRQALNSLNSFASSRQRAPYRSLNHTAGFQNGRENLDSLETDVSSTMVWLASENGTEKTTKAIKKALKPLDDLNSNMKSVEETWEPMNQNMKFAKTVLALVVDMPEDKNAVTKVYEVVDKFKKCYENNVPEQTDINDIENAKKSIENLNTEVRVFSNFGYIEDLKNLEALKNAVAYENKVHEDRVRATPKKLEELQKLDLDEIIRQINLFMKDMTALETFLNTLSFTVNDIKTGMGDINTYHQRVKSIEPLLNCLKANENNGILVTRMIESIRAIRALRVTQAVTETISFFKTIKSSSKQLTETLKTTESMKKLKEIEVKSLSEFKKESVSQDLGLAAQGLSAIHKVDRSRQELDALTGDVQYILNAADTYSNVENFMEHHTMLKTFDSLKTNLTEMFDNVDDVISEVSQRIWTDMKSNGVVFTTASKIKPVKTDVKKLKKAVEALKELDPSLQQDLDKMIGSLNTLEQLDLDFAKYKFAAAPGALEQLVEYFANWNKLITSHPGNSTKPGSSEQLAASDTEESGGMSVGTIIFCVICGVTLILLIFALCRKRLKRFRQKRKQAKKDKKKRIATQREAREVNQLKNYLFLADQIIEKMADLDRSMMTPRQVFNLELDEFKYSAALENNDFNRENKLMRRLNDVYCLKSTAVTVKTADNPKAFIHANFLAMPNSKWILAQAPLDGTEPHVDYDENNDKVLATSHKKNTIETHWQMIDQQDVALVVQLCDFKEKNEQACPVYYPLKVGETQVHGQYQLKMVESVDIEKEFTVYIGQYSVSRIEYTCGETKKCVDILRLTAWQDPIPVFETQPPLEIIKYIQKYPGKTILVHCSTGTGRTGMLAGINLGIEYCETETKPGMSTICALLRNSRCQALQNEVQVAYTMLVISKGMINKTNNRRFYDNYARLRWYYRELHNYKWAKFKAQPPKKEGLTQAVNYDIVEKYACDEAAKEDNLGADMYALEQVDVYREIMDRKAEKRKTEEREKEAKLAAEEQAKNAEKEKTEGKSVKMIKSIKRLGSKKTTSGHSSSKTKSAKSKKSKKESKTSVSVESKSS